MKITVEYDELEQAQYALHANDMRCAIDDALQHIRTNLKHGDPSEETGKELEAIRSLLFSGIQWDNNR